MVKFDAQTLKNDFLKFKENWLKIGSIMKKAIYSNSYQPQEETEFLSLKNTLSRQQKILSQRVPDPKEFDFGSSDIANLLRSRMVSLNQIVQYTENDKKMLIQEWHKVFIRINYVCGAFAFLEEREKNKPSIFKRIFLVFKKK